LGHHLHHISEITSASLSMMVSRFPEILIINGFSFFTLTDDCWHWCHTLYSNFRLLIFVSHLGWKAKQTTYNSELPSAPLQIPIIIVASAGIN
jgi:hypothetical protein